MEHLGMVSRSLAVFFAITCAHKTPSNIRQEGGKNATATKKRPGHSSALVLAMPGWMICGAP